VTFDDHSDKEGRQRFREIVEERERTTS